EGGVPPTATVGLAVGRLNAAGGIQIPASHNPAPWNGLKLFGGDGRVLAASEGQKVRARFEAGDFRRVEGAALGTLEECRRAEDWHRDRVLELVDGTRIPAAGLRTFLDANGGARGRLRARPAGGVPSPPVMHGGPRA